LAPDLVAAAPGGAEAAAVVAFWRAAGPDAWFAKDDAFDRRFREQFLALHLAASCRHCDGWSRTADGTLALVLLLDQFPRNAFRGTRRMYATDPLARHFARRGLATGQLGSIAADLRCFLYLPFSHSEDLADQDLAVSLHQGLAPRWVKGAVGHREIIRRFGRFPHRNAILGRETTPEEAAFLRDGGFAG
jgi:uncharacterized protein (DUF924 family)